MTTPAWITASDYGSSVADHGAGADDRQRPNPWLRRRRWRRAAIAPAALGIGGDLRGRRDVQILLAQGVADRGVDPPLEDVEVGLQVQLRSADVAPVAVVDVAVDEAGRPLGTRLLDGEQPRRMISGASSWST